MISALCYYAPERFTACILALRYIQNIAYLVNHIFFAVILSKFRVEVGQRAGKVYKLIAAEFVKLELAAVFLGNNSGCLSDTLKLFG